MVIKDHVDIENIAITNNLKRLTNQIYKLLPNREEGIDWQTPLTTVIEEFAGMSKLINNHTALFSLLCKLEGLYGLTEENDFHLFRRIIFECLSLVQDIKESVIACQD